MGRIHHKTRVNQGGGCILIPALLLLLAAGAAFAQQGPAQVIPDADMPAVGAACPSGYPANLIARETGRMLACVSSLWEDVSDGSMGVYPVLNYGAVCGGTDQEGEVNAAIDAANAAGGGVVYIPCDCTLGVDEQIVMKSNVHMTGCDRYTSKIEKQWTGTSFTGSTIVTNDMDGTPTKQNDWSVTNLRLDYDVDGCGGSECGGGMIGFYGDGFVISDVTGDWLNSWGFIGGGDYFLIDGNILRQEQATGVAGDDGIRIMIGGEGGIVSNNVVASGDDCYDGNFCDGCDGALDEAAVAGVGFYDNYCDSEVARLFSCVAQQDSDGTGSCQDIIVDGLYGEAGSYCLAFHDAAAEHCVGAGDPYVDCDGVGSGPTNLVDSDQISGIQVSNVRGTCATQGDQSDSTDRGILVRGVTDITLRNVHIDNTNAEGLEISDSDRVLFADGYIDASQGNDDTDEHAVVISNASSSISIVNSILKVDANRSGVVLTECDNCLAQGNTCIMSGTSGVCVNDAGAGTLDAIGNRIVPSVGFITGTDDTSSSHATIMTDSTAAFTVDAFIGEGILNVDDGNTCVITDNDATTVTCASGMDWDSGETYKIVSGQCINAGAGTVVAFNDCTWANSTASGNKGVVMFGNRGDNNGALGYRYRFPGDGTTAPQFYFDNQDTDGIMYFRFDTEITSGRIVELEGMTATDTVSEIYLGAQDTDDGYIAFGTAASGTMGEALRIENDNDLRWGGTTVDANFVYLRSEPTAATTVLTFPASGTNASMMGYIGTGTDPTSTCAVGETYLDTDGSTTATNCTGGSAGIARLCICTAIDTWTGVP